MTTLLQVGQNARVSRRIGPQQIDAYAALSAHRAAPGEVPEPLIDALFSYLLGVRLPGLGTNYLKQHSAFHGVARAGERLNATVTITRIRPDKQLVDLATCCRGDDGRLLCDGRALVYVGEVGKQ